MRTLINAIRSVLFNIAFLLMVIFFAGLWVMPRSVFAGEEAARKGVLQFCQLSMWLARVFMGIKYEYRGLEHLPKTGPVILAAAHQSYVDPILTYLVRQDVTALAKKELFSLPIIGVILKTMRIIRVDRQSGRAHEAMVGVGDTVRRNGQVLIVYPQATRTRPGVRRKLKSGVYHLAQDTDLPVYTVASNAGLFWTRGFFHRSGTIIFEIGPKLPDYETKADFMRAIEERVVFDSEKLMAEAGFGHLLKAQPAATAKAD